MIVMSTLYYFNKRSTRFDKIFAGADVRRDNRCELVLNRRSCSTLLRRVNERLCQYLCSDVGESLYPGLKVITTIICIRC